MDQQTLTEELDSFDRAERLEALRRLADRTGFPQSGENVNMHMHSFFSFNGHGHSPSHLVYRSGREGLYAAALCDFDVLDGLQEMHEAGIVCGLRTAVHLETRAYLREFADGDINSPGEAGVTYIMGAGFVDTPAKGSTEERVLRGFRERAQERNRKLVSRINDALPEIAVDYPRDVLPLTPSGNATERHIIRAYVNRSFEKMPDDRSRAAYWSRILGRPEAEVGSLMEDRASLEDAVRSRLVKRGGIGYEAPTETTFPPVDDFVSWVLSCRAVPMVAWLDGTSPGERDPRALLECLRAKGAAAVNIIPERNWNLSDPTEAAEKRARLREFVEACEQLRLPINIGTELNKQGLPFVDDLEGEVLRDYKQVFLNGARIMIGHALLFRYADLSYVDAEARDVDVSGRDAFFASVGALPPVDRTVDEALRSAGADGALTLIRDSVRAGGWTV